MKLDFGRILTRSWQIIWKHKILWIFGILAGCANGNGGSNGGGNNNGSSYDQNGNPQPFSDGQIEPLRRQFEDFFQQYMLIIIAVCILIVILSFAFYALGMMGRIGILKGVYKVENGAEALVFGELWSESLPFFWRIFGLNFLVGLAFAIIIIPLVVVGIVTAGIGFVCLIPILCILIPVGWVVAIILEQAQAAIVLEDLNMMDGFRRGWEIAKSDIGGMIVMALILMIGGAVIGLIIAMPVIVAVLPLIFSAPSLADATTIPATVWITIACCAIYFPVLLLLSGILTAYTKTAWALTFMQLAKPAENTPIVLPADA
jgi:hypothetical protein